MKTVTTNKKFARPARARGRQGSRYDALLDAAVDLDYGKGAAETFETPEAAAKALNGLRGRRARRELNKTLDAYIAEDGLTLVVTPFGAAPDDEE